MTAGNHERTVQKKNSQEEVHISKAQFWNWQAGRLNSAEEERFLGHIGACTFCAGQFASWMEEGCAGVEDFVDLVPEAGQFAGTLDPLLTELEEHSQSMSESGNFFPIKQEGILTAIKEDRTARQERNSLLAEPPAYLKEEILRRTRQMDVQAAVHIRETSRRVQFWMYSLKVGVAVMASIFLLMMTANVQNMDFETLRADQPRKQDVSKEVRITDTLKQKSGEISSILNNLSNGLFRINTDQTDQEEIRR